LWLAHTKETTMKKPAKMPAKGKGKSGKGKKGC
jgi:hypothetical protein